MLNRGFTLIEVLVTLVILLFGLLGIAGLMAKGQRAAFEAFQRQQALSLTADMTERILGNRSQAANYALGAPLNTPVGASNGLRYGALLNNNITNCAHAVCSNLEMQIYDIAMWEGQLLGYGESLVVGNTRVGGVVNANGCIEELAQTIATCPLPVPAPAGNLYTRTLRVSVAWQGTDDTSIPTTSTCGQGLYRSANNTGTYVISEASRRVVSTDVNVLVPCP
jgi:type IV pilus assembly protein PilV